MGRGGGGVVKEGGRGMVDGVQVAGRGKGRGDEDVVEVGEMGKGRGKGKENENGSPEKEVWEL